jgi:hypothetical protein
VPAAKRCGTKHRTASWFDALSRGKALVLRTRLRGSSQEQQSNAKKSRLQPLRLGDIQTKKITGVFRPLFFYLVNVNLS